MTDAPKARPLTAAELTQPQVESKIQRRERLLQSLAHLGVTTPYHLLQLVDPSSFKDATITSPGKGTGDWEKVSEVVNDDQSGLSEWVLDKLGVLSNKTFLPQNGKIERINIPFEKGQARDTAIAKAKKEITYARQGIMALAEEDPDGARKMLESLEKRETDLDELIARQDKGEKIKSIGSYNFIQKETIEDLRNAQVKGYNIRHRAASRLLMKGGFETAFVPKLQEIAKGIADEVAGVGDTLEQLSDDKAKVELAKQFALYILGRMGDSHDTDSNAWKAKIGQLSMILPSYALANLKPVESRDGKQKDVDVSEKPQLVGEKFVRFVYAYLFNPDKSAFPDKDPVVKHGIDMAYMPKLLNPVHLIMNTLGMGNKRRPQSVEEIRRFTEDDVKNAARKADKLGAYRGFVEKMNLAETAARLDAKAVIPFGAAMSEYLSIRKKFEPSYSPDPALSAVEPMLELFGKPLDRELVPTMVSGVKRGAMLGVFMVPRKGKKETDKEKKDRLALADEVGAVDSLLVGSNMRAMLVAAEDKTLTAEEKRFAYAAARIMFNLTQRALKRTLEDLNRYEPNVRSHPELSILVDKAKAEITHLKDGFSKEAQMIESYFEKNSALVKGELVDPKQVDFKLVRFAGTVENTPIPSKQVTETKEVPREKSVISRLIGTVKEPGQLHANHKDIGFPSGVERQNMSLAHATYYTFVSMWREKIKSFAGEGEDVTTLDADNAASGAALERAVIDVFKRVALALKSMESQGKLTKDMCVKAWNFGVCGKLPQFGFTEINEAELEKKLTELAGTKNKK